MNEITPFPCPSMAALRAAIDAADLPPDLRSILRGIVARVDALECEPGAARCQECWRARAH